MRKRRYLWLCALLGIGLLCGTLYLLLSLPLSRLARRLEARWKAATP